VKVYSLSIHADYRCRHSGACCSADWDVPVELPVYRSLADALAGGRVQPTPTDHGPFLTEPDLPDDAAAMLARTDKGDCVFYDRGSGLCVVHRDLGEPALPATCRHFPRVAVRDRRGIFISLSHFCPTAASMLFRDDVPLEIVESPVAFPPGDYTGLDVDDEAWPPMLHPRMLMDLEGYSAWERHMVRRCALDVAPESVVATISRDAELLRTWRPADGELAATIASLPEDIVPAPAAASLDDSLRLFDEALTAAPADLKPPPDEDGLAFAYVDRVRGAWSAFRAPINRFLAAKAFASWTAYQGRGLRSIVRGLDTALALVRVEAARECRNQGAPLDAASLREAFRCADFILNHLAVGEDLAANWSRAE
jgi:Fe-S-cluster containining protein